MKKLYLLLIAFACVGVIAVTILVRFYFATTRAEARAQDYISWGAYEDRIDEAERMTNDLAEAETMLSNVIKDYPERYGAYISLGVLFEKSGKTNLAYSNFLKAYSLCEHTPTNEIMGYRELQIEEKVLSNRMDKLRNSGFHPVD